MGSSCLCYCTENIERTTLLTKPCRRVPVVFSKRTDRVSTMSSSEDSRVSEKSLDCTTTEHLPAVSEEKTKEYGPSAISLNAEVTFKSSVNEQIRTCSVKSCVKSHVSNSVYRLNTLSKFRVDEGSVFDPSSTHRTMTESCTSSIKAAVPMTKILPHLYLGSYDDAINEFELQKKGITHILSLVGNNSPIDFVKHEIFPMHDRGRTELKSVLKKVSRFVNLGQQDGNSVLVHCQSGQNRSAVLVIALMMKEKKTLYRAHKTVKSLRPIIQINEGYAKQLLTLEKEIFGKNSLPFEWMERGEFNLSTGEVTYKYETVNSAQHREMFGS